MIYDKLCSLLEPSQLQPIKRGIFSHVVPADQTQYLLASWGTHLGCGRLELRQPTKPLPIRGVTLSGFHPASSAILLTPREYAGIDTEDLYDARRDAIHEMQTRYIGFDAPNQYKPFLTGAYGAIMLRMYTHDYCWLAAIHNGTWFSFSNELGDSEEDWQRLDIDLMLPLDKRTVSQATTASARKKPYVFDTGNGGGIVFVLLPSNWVEDNTAYNFRDDFMGASLDTSKWTKTGDVEIDPNYQWLRMRGAGAWGSCGLRSVQGFGRDKSMIVDVYPTNQSPFEQATTYTLVGWSKGSSINYTDFEHALIFGAPGKLYVYESGVSRGEVGSGFTSGGIYRVKISLSPSGAEYFVQGGAQYPDLGSDQWTNITPTVSAGASSQLYLGASQFSAIDCYLSDFRVI